MKGWEFNTMRGIFRFTCGLRRGGMALLAALSLAISLTNFAPHARKSLRFPKALKSGNSYNCLPTPRCRLGSGTKCRRRRPKVAQALLRASNMR